MQQLSKFFGGLVLDGHKQMSMSSACATTPLPKKLLVPVQQHIGLAAEITVAVGEKVLKGQQLTKPGDDISAAVHAPSSGTVTAIDEQSVPHPSGLKALCISIETDGEDTWRERNPIGENYKDKSVTELLEQIHQSGIVGLGGATFPTAAKLQGSNHKPVDTLIINGAECEPYISCDDRLMQDRAMDIILGTQVLQHILGANNIIIAVEDNKLIAIESLQSASKKLSATDIHITAIPTRYPTGGEKQLIKVITGKEVPAQGRPADIGVLCQNVATVASVYHAIYLDEPVISRIVTVTGDAVNEPQNIEALIGTPMSALIEQAGGYKDNIASLIMGGPMMGFALASDELPVTKACNCLLTQSKEQQQPANVNACIRCGECAAVCPAQLLPQQLYWYCSSKNFDRAQDINLFDCIECGCCSYVCPSQIPLVQYYRFAKNEIWAQEKDRAKSDIARQRHEFREARIAREKAEREEKLRKKKEMLAKKKAAEDKKASTTQTEVDPKKAAIEAALARVKAKKEATKVEPKNTDNLTDAQQQQIDEANQRRQGSQQTTAKEDK